MSASEIERSGHDLGTVVSAAFERRVHPVEALSAQAGAIALACRDSAARFHRGGRLLVFGNGAAATDSQHVAVEFVHPVIVGKRSLPATSLVADIATVLGIATSRGFEAVFAHQIEVLGTPVDIALGISSDGECENVIRGLDAARTNGLLTIALLGGDGGRIATSGVADHCLIAASDDPRVVKECHVTIYHLLWELVHVFFDHPEVLGGSAEVPRAGVNLQSLYPLLYQGASAPEEVLESVAESSRQKVAEIVALRREVGVAIRDQMADCATAMAAAFDSGATLLAFGNGGSSTDAQDLVHTFSDPPDGTRALPALGLTGDVAVLTALTNDVGFDLVFARQVQALGKAGDIAFGISTSGGSDNVLSAFDQAKKLGMLTVGLSGYDGGRMAQLGSLDQLIIVPSSSVHRVQEVQTTIYHVLWETVQACLSR